jgi:hypothetical protein
LDYQALISKFESGNRGPPKNRLAILLEIDFRSIMAWLKEKIIHEVGTMSLL